MQDEIISLIEDKKIVNNFLEIKKAEEDEDDIYKNISLLTEYIVYIISLVNDESKNILKIDFNIFVNKNIYSILKNLRLIEKNYDLEKLFKLLHLYNKFEKDFIKKIDSRLLNSVADSYIDLYLLLDTKVKIINSYNNKIKVLDSDSMYDYIPRENISNLVEDTNNVVKLIKKR